jgi:hypothetical protein
MLKLTPKTRFQRQAKPTAGQRMPPCGASATSSAQTLQNVKEYYGKVLGTSKDLKTSACTAAGRPHRDIVKIMRDVPQEIKAKFYGCGAPLPLGVDGLRLLDLGSGSGRDCYIASSLVGEHGAVQRICLCIFCAVWASGASSTQTPYSHGSCKVPALLLGILSRTALRMCMLELMQETLKWGTH